MPFVMSRRGDAFVPDVRCDQCGELAPAETGLVLWLLRSGTRTRPAESVLVACGEECADRLASRHRLGELAGVALDAYIASLVHYLEIDPRAVLEREETARALEQTRDQAPE
jgi:hypothetical protein